MEPARLTYTALIAAEIRAAMARLAINQSDVTAATGMTPATLSRKLSGQGRFTVAEVADIADCLGITVSELARRAEQSQVGAA
jgi:transcriptional regulator with XRE-family HTH domain